MRFSSVIVFSCLVISSYSVSIWRKSSQENPNFGLTIPINNNRIQNGRKLNGSIIIVNEDVIFKNTAIKVLSDLFSDQRLFTNRQDRSRKFGSGRQINITKNNPIVMVFVDIIMNYLRPMLDGGAIKFSGMVKPVLMYVTTLIFGSGLNLVRTFVIPTEKGDLKVLNTIKDPERPHIVYPVVIPGFGSYMLVSDFGAFDSLSNSTKQAMIYPVSTTSSSLPTPGTTPSFITTTTEKTTPVSRESNEENGKTKELDRTTTENIVKTTFKPLNIEKMDIIKNRDSNDTLDDQAYEDEFEKFEKETVNTYDKNQINREKTESEEKLWNKEIDDIVAASLKQIIGNRTTLTFEKKTMLLNIINKLEHEIINL